MIGSDAMCKIYNKQLAGIFPGALPSSLRPNVENKETKFSTVEKFRNPPPTGRFSSLLAYQDLPKNSLTQTGPHLPA